MYRNNSEILGLLLIVFLLVGLCSCALLPDLANVQNFEAKVVKTQIDGGNTYFVLQKVGETKTEVFSNDDNILFGKTNSSDFLMNLEVGKTYHFTTTGWRIPLFSMYQNIVSYYDISQ